MGGTVVDEQLDLRRHGPEEVPGKSIQLCGAKYLLGRQVRGPEGSHVFAMLNERTGLSLFLVEICWTKPDSAQDQELRRNRRITLFALEDVEPMPPYTECHEIEGGLLTLQPNPEVALDPDFHDDLMRMAWSSAAERRWDAAKNAYLGVLAKNQYHTLAIKGLAGYPWRIDETGDILRLLMTGIETEPNCPELYRLKASFLTNMGQPLSALQTLDQTLKRYHWDGRTWACKARFAQRFGLVSELEQMRSDLMGTQKSVPNGSRLNRLIAELDHQANEAAGIQGVIHSALELQQKKNWTTALAKWESISGNRLDAFNQLNVSICRFHLGQYEQTAGEALRLGWALAGAELAHRAATALAWMASQRAKDNKTALQLMRYLARVKGLPLDMPSVPLLVHSDTQAVNEDRASEAILTTLDALKPFCLTDEDLKAHQRLKELYLERDRQLSESSPTLQAERAKPWWRFW